MKQNNKLKKNQKEVQEEHYDFPYHYGSLLAKHRGIQYRSTISAIITVIKKYDFKTSADVGCGDAFFIYNFKKNLKYRKIEGYDYSQKALKFAKAFNPEINFFTNDITKETLEKKYDLILLQDMIEHIEPENLINLKKNLIKSLKNNGYVIITVPTDNTSLGKKHYQHFNIDKIRKLFKEFEVKDFMYLNSKNKLKNFIFNFFIWCCYSTYPFKVTKLKFLYDFFYNLTYDFYNKYMLYVKFNERRRLLVVLKK